MATGVSFADQPTVKEFDASETVTPMTAYESPSSTVARETQYNETLPMPSGAGASEIDDLIYSSSVKNAPNICCQEVPISQVSDTVDVMKTRSDEITGSGDIDLQVNTGPNLGVHTTGFRRAKYDPDEWHDSNYAKYYASFGTRDAAEYCRQEADRCMKETEKKTSERQKTATKKLAERLHDSQFWLHELEKEISDIVDEDASLVKQKERLENALRSTEIPLHIASDNLNCRRRRQGVDLVQDGVELNLLKEVEIINNAQDLLRKAIEQAERQIKANRDVKTQLELDWSDKKEAHELDTQAGQITNETTNKQLHAGAAVFQQVQSTPESWAQFSHDNILLAENERMASVQLRELISNLLEDIARDMQEQYDTVNKEFHHRLDEVEDAKYKLEENLKHVTSDIVKEEKSIDDLKVAIKAKENPLKVATSRLYTRQSRPNVELCRDDPQYHLVGEVQEIQQSIDELTKNLRDAEVARKRLMDDRMQLEREISNKKNTLFIDRQKCLSHRSRYPTTSRLLGYNN